MAKFISKAQLTGEKGVAKFQNFCVNHEPQILFREKAKHDFGVDAEIELIRKNEEGKYEVTGEILAVQIKSTESNTGYIKKESNTSIEIHIRKEDLEYWSNYKNDVLVVFYDVRNDILYCHKVTQQDYQFVNKGLNQTIELNKTSDVLVEGENNFEQRFSSYFKERVNFSATETIYTNLLPYKKIPKILYQFSLSEKIKTKKDFYKAFIGKTDLKIVIYNQQVYSFEDLRNIPELKDIIINENIQLILLQNLKSDLVLQNHYIELLNLYLKDFLYFKGLNYSKDYRRYYFFKPHNSLFREVMNISKHRKNSKPKKVVAYYEYGRDKFFRHHAIEIQHLFLDNTLYLSILPKYLFTEDGKVTLAPAKITKYTNYLTAREFNKNVLWHNNFIFNYLADKNQIINIWESKNYEIVLIEPKRFQVPFGIPLDSKKRKNAKHSTDSETIQTSINFTDEN